MKVLKKGRPQKGWSKEMICTGHGNGGGGCGAKLLVEQADVFSTYHVSYGDDVGDSYNWFKCVECGVTTEVKLSLPFDAPRRSEP